MDSTATYRPMSRQISRQVSRQVSLGIPAPTLGGLRVRPTSKARVVPSRPIEDHWLPLSNLDRVVNPTFSSVIIFYRNLVTPVRRFRDVTRQLKESLGQVLVDFYPLAGRLELKEDGLVDLHCSGKGAIFIEASVEADLDAIGGPQPMPDLSGLEIAGLGHGPKYVPDQLTPLPTLVVQVTSFKCGSIAIAANWHHTVADGSSGCHFMKCWSEVANGKGISVLPNHDRFILKPREKLDASLVNGYSTRTVQEVSYKKPANVPHSVDRAVLNTFRIGKKEVQGLKERVNRESTDKKFQYTSAECVSAHLWRQMTKARMEENGGETPDADTRFFMFVDGRKKLNMPPGYFGNVVCSACAVSSEQEILENNLSFAAYHIRTATRNISAEYFRSLIDWVEVQGTASSKSEHVNSLGHDVAATFWTFFPLYEINFGWGRPALAARNSPARPQIDGIAMMPSFEGSGNMVALLNLEPDRMERLQTQPSFKIVYSW